PAFDKLKTTHPHLYEILKEKIGDYEYAWVKNLPSAGGLYTGESIMGPVTAFVIDNDVRNVLETYYASGKPEREGAVRDFVYLLLVHEGTELAVRKSDETITPDLASELHALIVKARAYYTLTDGERSALCALLTELDQNEPDISDRFMPVIETIEQFDNETIISPEGLDTLLDLIFEDPDYHEKSDRNSAEIKDIVVQFLKAWKAKGEKKTKKRIGVSADDSEEDKLTALKKYIQGVILERLNDIADITNDLGALATKEHIPLIEDAGVELVASLPSTIEYMDYGSSNEIWPPMKVERPNPAITETKIKVKKLIEAIEKIDKGITEDDFPLDIDGSRYSLQWPNTGNSMWGRDIDKFKKLEETGKKENYRAISFGQYKGDEVASFMAFVQTEISSSEIEEIIPYCLMYGEVHYNEWYEHGILCPKEKLSRVVELLRAWKEFPPLENIPEDINTVTIEGESYRLCPPLQSDPTPGRRFAGRVGGDDDAFSDGTKLGIDFEYQYSHIDRHYGGADDSYHHGDPSEFIDFVRANISEEEALALRRYVVSSRDTTRHSTTSIDHKGVLFPKEKLSRVVQLMRAWKEFPPLEQIDEDVDEVTIGEKAYKVCPPWQGDYIPGQSRYFIDNKEGDYQIFDDETHIGIDLQHDYYSCGSADFSTPSVHKYDHGDPAEFIAFVKENISEKEAAELTVYDVFNHSSREGTHQTKHNGVVFPKEKLSRVVQLLKAWKQGYRKSPDYGKEQELHKENTIASTEKDGARTVLPSPKAVDSDRTFSLSTSNRQNLTTIGEKEFKQFLYRYFQAYEDELDLPLTMDVFSHLRNEEFDGWFYQYMKMNQLDDAPPTVSKGARPVPINSLIRLNENEIKKKLDKLRKGKKVFLQLRYIWDDGYFEKLEDGYKHHGKQHECTLKVKIVPDIKENQYHMQFKHIDELGNQGKWSPLKTITIALLSPRQEDRLIQTTVQEIDYRTAALQEYLIELFDKNCDESLYRYGDDEDGEIDRDEKIKGPQFFIAPNEIGCIQSNYRNIAHGFEKMRGGEEAVIELIYQERDVMPYGHGRYLRKTTYKLTISPNADKMTHNINVQIHVKTPGLDNNIEKNMMTGRLAQLRYLEEYKDCDLRPLPPPALYAPVDLVDYYINTQNHFRYFENLLRNDSADIRGTAWKWLHQNDPQKYHELKAQAGPKVRYNKPLDTVSPANLSPFISNPEELLGDFDPSIRQAVWDWSDCRKYLPRAKGPYNYYKQPKKYTPTDIVRYIGIPYELLGHEDTNIRGTAWEWLRQNDPEKFEEMLEQVGLTSEEYTSTPSGSSLVSSRIGRKLALPSNVGGIEVEDAIEEAMLQPAFDKMKTTHPHLYEILKGKIGDYEYAWVKNLPSAGGLYTGESIMGPVTAFVIDNDVRKILEMYYTSGEPEKRGAVRDFVYLLLVHEGTELAVRNSDETITPDIESELHALIAKAQAYYALTDAERSALCVLLTELDQNEPDISDRFMPVIKTIEQFNHGTIISQQGIDALLDLIFQDPEYNEKNARDSGEVKEMKTRIAGGMKKKCLDKLEEVQKLFARTEVFSENTRLKELIETKLDGRVKSVAFSPNGNEILVGSGHPDETHRLYRVERDTNGKATGLSEPIETRVNAFVYCVAFSPDGNEILVGSGYKHRLYRVERDTNGKATGLSEPIEKSVDGAAKSVAFSPDGNEILVGSDQDKTHRLYRVERDTNGKATGLSEPIETTIEGGVLSVAFSPDGSEILVGSWFDGHRLYRVERDTNGKATGLSDPIETTIKGDINCVAFSPDGNEILVGIPEQILLYYVDRDEQGKAIRLSDPIETDIGARVYSFGFSPDGSEILVGSYAMHLLYRVERDANRRAIALSEPVVTTVEFGKQSVAFSPEGNEILVGSDQDNAHRLYQVLRESEETISQTKAALTDEIIRVKKQIDELNLVLEHSTLVSSRLGRKLELPSDLGVIEVEDAIEEAMLQPAFDKLKTTHPHLYEILKEKIGDYEYAWVKNLPS
ncbi:MAG: hypothetical protein KKH94_04410, partial [Candidatus Omnitrophica bacterium]|nr:hypothetical protein [Candidatus Omnitrophota bacterium]